MRTHTRWLPTLLLPLMLVCARVDAQEQGDEPEMEEPETQAETDEPSDSRPGWILAEIGYWMAQPTGLAYVPATVRDPQDPLGTRLLDVTHGTEQRPRYRLGYRFKDNIGEFMLTYYSQLQNSGTSGFDPGRFVFGESQSHPAFAGLFNDGAADGFEATTSTLLRDLRLDFSRETVHSARVRVRWFVGTRRITHTRTQDVAYHAILPSVDDFPRVVPIRDDLTPRPDLSRSQSAYNGRGAGAGMEVAFPIGGENSKFTFEAGFALAVLRGRVEATYTSINHAYAIVRGDDDITLIDPPYEEFLQIDPLDPQNPPPPLVNRIQQVDMRIGLRTPSVSLTGQVIDTHLGFRWRAWRNLEAFAGFRGVRYGNVGAELRPGTATLVGYARDRSTGVLFGIFNSQDSRRTDHSVDYEGYYLGLSYRY